MHLTQSGGISAIACNRPNKESLVHGTQQATLTVHSFFIQLLRQMGCFNPLDYINMHIRTSPAYGRVVRPNPSKRARGGIERAQTANAQQEARAVERLGRRWIEQQVRQ